MKRKDEEEHQAICSEAYINCEKCQMEIRRKEMGHNCMMAMG